MHCIVLMPLCWLLLLLIPGFALRRWCNVNKIRGNGPLLSSLLSREHFSEADVANAIETWKTFGQTNVNQNRNFSQSLVVKSTDHGRSASDYLKQHLAVNAKFVYRLCKGGFVLVNETKIFATRKLLQGDVITILSHSFEDCSKNNIVKDDIYIRRLTSFTNSLLQSSQPCIQTLYDDDHLAVVYKPPGLHTLQWVGTMKKQFFALDDILPILIPPSHDQQQLRNGAKSLNWLDRPLPCHRLDARVPGCVLVAKTQDALLALNSQFAERKVKKEYAALLAGKIDFMHCSTNIAGCSLGEDEEQRPVLHIRHPVGGRETHSVLRVVRATPCNVYGTISHVALYPLTGRKHQLRQHCALLGCPILGDDLYHRAAYFPEGRQREEMIALAGEGSGKEDKEDKEEEEEEAGERRNNSSPKVRKGIGLMLMSKSIEFTHPAPLWMAERLGGMATANTSTVQVLNPPQSAVQDGVELPGQDHMALLEAVTYNLSTQRLTVRIKELNKYARIFEKAHKGALHVASS